MNSTDLPLYTATANASARVVIRRYSTSFGWASRLLPGSMRDHIARIYALVRIADELVDGPAEAAGVDRETRAAMLDDLEAETERALRRGFSTNLVVHAFAVTARAHGIGIELCGPFFASMRRDLDSVVFDQAQLDEYIHGSAEVVGLMCVAVFEAGIVREHSERERLQEGARRLGAAFQKVNFLRDFSGDHDDLGRTYLAAAAPTSPAPALTDEAKTEAIASIRQDLRVADGAIPLLDPACRPAVWAARAMFGELTDRLDAAPASVLMTTRVRVPDYVKARILMRALAMKARP
ncbi:phytoene/squalene synthase family protein [Microbacterium sp. AK031]|uniref:phytoene/squalene synthase family protein n=1 Tax=Microbacterium sp. AK031 TaxID=2723076 RepID=UPI002167FACE|nr:phytoene/squalene synthase family protein [Microbacterium sp. AK031]MCS3844382.1 phytoene/squalene synthetase [Microbacterium sp. AK031]